MSLFIISYDLHNQRTYEPVWKFLQNLGAVRLLESVWVVSATATATGIRDALISVMDSDDSCAVIELQPGVGWGTVRAIPAGTNWLSQFVARSVP